MFQGGAYGNEWILGDHRNATATTDTTGQITDLVDYADFGAPGYESTGWASIVGNDGQPGDPTLGLDNYYARDYDTITGTWIQPDQWRGLLVRPQSLNRYAYIENTPVTFSDHLGYMIRAIPTIDGGGGKKSPTAWLTSQIQKFGTPGLKTGAPRPKADPHAGRWPTPKGKVKKPGNRSSSFTSATHPPCVLSFQACGSASPNASVSPLTAKQWAGIGFAIGGALLIAAGAACVVATVGICAAPIAVIGGAGLALAGGGAVVATGTTITAGAAIGGVSAVGGAAAIAGGTGLLFNGTSGSGGSNGQSPNQLNQSIQRGQAPPGLVRVDTPPAGHPSSATTCSITASSSGYRRRRSARGPRGQARALTRCFWGPLPAHVFRTSAGAFPSRAWVEA